LSDGTTALFRKSSRLRPPTLYFFFFFSQEVLASKSRPGNSLPSIRAAERIVGDPCRTVCFFRSVACGRTFMSSLPPFPAVIPSCSPTWLFPSATPLLFPKRFLVSPVSALKGHFSESSAGILFPTYVSFRSLLERSFPSFSISLPPLRGVGPRSRSSSGLSSTPHMN